MVRIKEDEMAVLLVLDTNQESKRKVDLNPIFES